MRLGSHVVVPRPDCDVMRSPAAELQCEYPGSVEKLRERGRGEGGEMRPIYIAVLCFASKVWGNGSMWPGLY